MQESAASAPFAAWLWNFPLVMLSTNAFFFSASANSRFEVNFPVAENPCASFSGVCGVCQASSPQIPKGPEYGDCDVPFVPKNRSVTSHHPFANCVELNVTSIPSGYVNTTLRGVYVS